MSRVFVKNLAKKATESDIQKHFQSIGPITEIRLLLKEDGTSRRVAYVGFLDEASANKAIAKLNHSYIRTSRISVEKALSRSAIEAEQKLRERRTVKGGIKSVWLNTRVEHANSSNKCGRKAVRSCKNTSRLPVNAHGKIT